MANIGSLEIGAIINVDNVKAGLRDVARGLEEAGTHAKSAFGDMSRLGSAMGPVAGLLTKIGVGIASTFLGIAAVAPQVAPHIERMKTEFFRLSTVVGGILEPVFGSMSKVFSDFVDWMGSPQGIAVLTALKNVMLGIGSAVLGAVAALKKITEKTWNIAVTIGEIPIGGTTVAGIAGGAAELAALPFEVPGMVAEAEGAKAGTFAERFLARLVEITDKMLGKTDEAIEKNSNTVDMV